MKYHPDKSPGKASEARFKEVNQANEVLSDKTKRALYDEFGEESLRVGVSLTGASLTGSGLLMTEYWASRLPKSKVRYFAYEEDYIGRVRAIFHGRAAK